MSDGLFSTVELAGTARAGFRLHHVEVFNWGTFDKRVWRLAPSGETALLTGDIGSGKSTLVDAVTTLLLPAHRISYNKAAGADSKERTLRSYVEGHYKSERIEATGASRAIGLRDQRAYSVILGVFVNEGYDETVSLAQVFHQKERAGQPDRFFVTSDKALTIESDFTAFGSDLTDLRKRLRSAGAELHTVFPDYARSARRRLGIASDQAMELFHQTVSMKSVGNLNEFVRSHMLEPVDAKDKVKGIVGHFEDLTKAHDAVKRAREQLAALSPLVATAEKYDVTRARRTELEQQRDAVRLFFAELRIRLLSEEIAVTTELRASRAAESQAAAGERRELTQQLKDLIAERAGAGGDRVSELDRLAGVARSEADERRSRRQRFDDRVVTAGLSAVTDAAGFATVRAELASVRNDSVERRRELDARFADVVGRLTELGRSAAETRAELTSLASRTSNLPSSQLDVRGQLCRELGIEASDLPFAGELLDVADEFSAWRGAAERVLRGFALSLLVPQQHYDRVAGWVNAHRLTHRRNDGRVTGSRLVYERVAARRVALQRTTDPEVLRLSDTVEIAAGPFGDYLRDQLLKRADYVCAASLEALLGTARAVTREGQVRSHDRHEKDDRTRIDDPRSWVLGWVNERKVEALTAQLVDQQDQTLGLEGERDGVSSDRELLGDRLSALSALEDYRSWTELDWEEALTRADLLTAERDRLVAGSSALAEIERRLKANEEQSDRLDERIRLLDGELATFDYRIREAVQACDEDERFVTARPDLEATAARASYPLLEERLAGALPRRPDECRLAADRLTDDLDAAVRRINTELGGYVQSLQHYMSEIRRLWPEATTEMDASIESLTEFRAFHDRVAQDDLPRFEADFKDQLNTNTIRELAGFNNWLNRQADEIAARVDRINEAMGAIDYSPGRYIRLEKERTINQEVQSFRQDLRNATNDALAPDDDQYSEQRFLQVQRLIERFRGREGHAEADRTWTRRVTDVRNWFTFSASERDRETEQEWEHYRDSDGKSGGQKEKLAYTILAASLAYQFGLEWGAERSRDFRFAVIDEAFGRGSDASTRYALELFAKLGLQLLIVTPLQKVHVIEPYVSAIGFVDNPTGKYSRMHTLTIEEFHDLREHHS